MTEKEYFGDWLNILNLDVIKSILPKISNCLIEPRFQDIFKAFTLVSFHDLKAVFLGQDPYPQRGVATGILFGNKQESKEVSPSLQVIKEACIDYSVPHNNIKFDNTLESWGRQGVLLLNSSLTVIVGKPNSHSMVWRPFIKDLLNRLSEYPGIIYVLFGNIAQSFEPYINSRFNDIIKVNHPAYYARLNKSMPHSVFKTIDKLMIGKYGKSIKWYNEQKD
ncbi:MAG: uracil-DNA glycosylase [Lachnospiraceae bacterium]|nr:uracil-DNA glycosylase [Lachnospiraceae bacterium]